MAWKVPTHIPAGSRSSSFRTRSRISPAALLVKVSARIESGATPNSSTRLATRVVSTRVLPEPAPASTRSGPSKCSAASRCSGLSVWRWVELMYGEFDSLKVRGPDAGLERPGPSPGRTASPERIRHPERSRRVPLAPGAHRRPAPGDAPSPGAKSKGPSGPWCAPPPCSGRCPVTLSEVEGSLCVARAARRTRYPRAPGSRIGFPAGAIAGVGSFAALRTTIAAGEARAPPGVSRSPPPPAA